MSKTNENQYKQTITKTIATTENSLGQLERFLHASFPLPLPPSPLPLPPTSYPPPVGTGWILINLSRVLHGKFSCLCETNCVSVINYSENKYSLGNLLYIRPKISQQYFVNWLFRPKEGICMQAAICNCYFNCYFILSAANFSRLEQFVFYAS